MKKTQDIAKMTKRNQNNTIAPTKNKINNNEQELRNSRLVTVLLDRMKVPVYAYLWAEEAFFISPYEPIIRCQCIFLCLCLLL